MAKDFVHDSLIMINFQAAGAFLSDWFVGFICWSYLRIMSGDIDDEEAAMRMLNEYEHVETQTFADQVWQFLESARRVIRGEIQQDEGVVPPVYNAVPTCPQEEANIKSDVLNDPSVGDTSNCRGSQHMFVVYKGGDSAFCQIVAVNNSKSLWSFSPNTMSVYT